MEEEKKISFKFNGTKAKCPYCRKVLTELIEIEEKFEKIYQKIHYLLICPHCHCVVGSGVYNP